METVRHHGRETAYRLRGSESEGRPILFVHGSGGSGDLWSAQYRLTDRRPVATVDLSGHGESTAIDTEPGTTTLSAYCEDIRAVQETIGATVLCGSSMGAAVILHGMVTGALDHEHIAGCILVGAGSRMPVDRAVLKQLNNNFEDAIRLMTTPGALVAPDRPRLADVVAEQFLSTDRDVIIQDLASCNAFDVSEYLSAITIPTLVVAGEIDPVTPLNWNVELACNLPRAGLISIPGCGHLPMLERPQTFNMQVRTFLDLFTG